MPRPGPPISSVRMYPSVIVKMPGKRCRHGSFAAGTYCRAFASMPATAGTRAEMPTEWIERRAGTREILHAQEQLVLLRGGGHQHRLALAFAGFQCHTRVAHFAREHEAFEIRQRFVDDDRTQPRGFVHDVLPVRLEIPRRRLLDIENALEPFGRPGADPAETFQDVLHVGTALVEIQAIRQIRDASLAPARSRRSDRSPASVRRPTTGRHPAA